MIDEKYRNYLYYHGEENCPYHPCTGIAFWWRIEKYAFENNDNKKPYELSDTMIAYLREHMWEGDGMPDTTLEEALKRASYLYEEGLWSRSYICQKSYTIEQVYQEKL